MLTVRENHTCGQFKENIFHNFRCEQQLQLTNLFLSSPLLMMINFRLGDGDVH